MYEYKGEVIRVIDGDTLELDIDLGFNTILHKIKVRLLNIDCPESYHPRNILEKEHGLAAKQFVIDNVLNKEVIIKTYKDKKGKYGRYLADIIYDNKNLVNELKIHGFEKKDSYE